MHILKTGAEAPTLPEITRHKIVWSNPYDLEYYAPFAREHTDQHIDQFMDTIVKYGSALPVITNGYDIIIAGHGRVEAALELALTEVPTIPLPWLTEKERKRYIKTMMQFGRYVGWTREMLQIDLQHLKKYRLNTMAKINGRFFHANGKEEIFGPKPF